MLRFTEGLFVLHTKDLTSTFSNCIEKPFFPNHYMKHFLLLSRPFSSAIIWLSTVVHFLCQVIPIFQDHFIKTGISLQKTIDMSTKRKIMTPKPLHQGAHLVIN